MSDGLARLEALLSQHMTSSQAESRERAREAQALREQVSVIDGRITTLTNKQLELESRQSRLERSQEQTHGIALGARESNAELQGIMMRELGSLKRDTNAQNTILANQDKVLAQQNTALAEIRSGTSELVEAEKFRKQEAAAWHKRRDALTSWTKMLIGVATVLGAIGTIIWAVFKMAIENAH